MIACRGFVEPCVGVLDAQAGQPVVIHPGRLAAAAR
jgi:hypothetical protein